MTRPVRLLTAQKILLRIRAQIAERTVRGDVAPRSRLEAWDADLEVVNENLKAAIEESLDLEAAWVERRIAVVRLLLEQELP